MYSRIREIEKNVGKFSDYTFNSSNKFLTSGPHIQPQQRLAFQLMRPLDCNEAINSEITTTNSATPLSKLPENNSYIYIHSLTGRNEVFTITSSRMNELLTSAKVYVNKNLLSEEDYKACLGKSAEFRNMYQAHRNYQPNINHIDNLSPAICHAQKIDLLVTQMIDARGMAISDGKSGQSNAGDNAIILLSAPALDFRKNDLKDDSDAAKMIIKGMYRNLFRAALDNKCQCIALPAGGLGEFLGNPDTYFKCLKEVANEAEFQYLYIIYNPRDKNIAKFDEYFPNTVASNVIRTEKDILFFADELIKQNISCAVHNPSTKGAVFGEVDIGNKWKLTNAYAYAAEEHIAAISTAFINSFFLRPFAFVNPNNQQNQINQTQSNHQLYDNNNYSYPEQAQRQQYDQQLETRTQFIQHTSPYQQVYQQNDPQLNQNQYYQYPSYQQPNQNSQYLYQQENQNPQYLNPCYQYPSYQQPYQYPSYQHYQDQQYLQQQQLQQQNQQKHYQHTPHQLFQPIQARSSNSVQQQPQYEWSKLFNYPTKTEGLSVSLAEKLKNFLHTNYLPYIEKKQNGFYFGFNKEPHRDLVMHMLSEFSFENLQFVSFQQAKNGNISSAKTNLFQTILNSDNNVKYNFGIFIPHDETNANKEKMGLLFATAFLPTINITADKLKKWQAMYENMTAFGNYEASQCVNSSMLVSLKRLF